MVRPITMPKLGQSEEVGTLVRWRKKVGDSVAKGDILFEIETDKAILEVESFFEGTLLKTVVQEGATVPINTTVGFVGDPGEAVPVVAAAAPEARKPEPAAVPRETPRAPATPAVAVMPEARAERILVGAIRESSPRPAPSVTAAPEVFRISPRAAKLAKESAINPSPIAGGALGQDCRARCKGLPQVQGLL